MKYLHPARRAPRVAALVGLAMFASACGSSSAGSSSPTTAKAAPSTSGAPTSTAAPSTTGASAAASTTMAAASMKTTYPVTITDCGGHTSTFKSAPTKPVTMDPQAYELMFWLGLGQKQFAGSPQPLPAVPDQFKEATKTVTTIARAADAEYITKEALLATAPDFVFGSYGSAFTAPSLFTEDELGAKGINVYYSFGIGGCKDDDPKAPRATLDATFRDLENLGKIFDVQEAAMALETKMKDDLKNALASVKPSASKVKVTTLGADNTLKGAPGYWGSGSTVNAIINLAGGVNAFADLSGGYGTTTIEEIIKRNPDVIMLVAYPAAIPQAWDDLESYLSSTPALAGVSAVKNKRFARVTFPEVGAGGVRNVDGVKKVAAAVAAATAG